MTSEEDLPDKIGHRLIIHTRRQRLKMVYNKEGQSSFCSRTQSTCQNQQGKVYGSKNIFQKMEFFPKKSLQGHFRVAYHGERHARQSIFVMLGKSVALTLRHNDVGIPWNLPYSNRRASERFFSVYFPYLTAKTAPLRSSAVKKFSSSKA